MVLLGQEQMLLCSAGSEAVAGTGQQKEQQEVKAELGEEDVLVVQVSVQMGDVELGAVAQMVRQEVQEQVLELLLLVVAEVPGLGEYDEEQGYDQEQEKANSDELVEAELNSEHGSLETLEALQESSQGRKNWTFVPVKLKKKYSIYKGRARMLFRKQCLLTKKNTKLLYFLDVVSLRRSGQP